MVAFRYPGILQYMYFLMEESVDFVWFPHHSKRVFASFTLGNNQSNVDLKAFQFENQSNEDLDLKVSSRISEGNMGWI